ncbi:MAG: hypothetical protein DKT66_20105 [Candidatus Melainabacteria bacterium]|nr:MAG: hypothetical protein DKT66_20105 [Candidatus Melainabacteria bacterium]
MKKMKSPYSKVIIISILVVNTILGGYLLMHDINNKSGDLNTEIQRYEEIQRRVLDSNCPKCGGQFENGFLLDRSRSSIHVTTWVQGSPKVDGARCQRRARFTCCDQALQGMRLFRIIRKIGVT